MTRSLKIGITGTHSSGKSTFMAELTAAAERVGLRVARIGDVARRAGEVGFPILKDHTAESTLWIMAECLRREAEASLHHDLILVDRPPLDALAYLEAALEFTGRTIDPASSARLEAIAASDADSYDLLVATVLDPGIPIGPERDRDEAFRAAAARHVLGVVDRIAPGAVRMTAQSRQNVVEGAVEKILRAAGRRDGSPGMDRGSPGDAPR